MLTLDASLMRRRTFLKQSVAVAGIFSGLPAISFGQTPTLTMVLRGGKAFYQGSWQRPDIGIDTAGKLHIGEAGTLEASKIIQLDDKVVSPGFIDILTDNTANPQKSYAIVEKFKVSDGVTTALQMHGGSAQIEAHYKAFGAKPHWTSYGVSTAVMRVRYAATSLTERKRRVEQCLAEGALGVSHSIEYQPTPYDEVLAYARLARKYNRPLFLHLRYSSEGQELEGVDEAISLARESGARVHISHLHSTGGTFHMAEALTKLRQANAQGQEITCCVYPYSYWATYLHSTRFDEGWQKRYGLTFHDLQLVGTGERLTASSFAKYRALKKLVAVPEGTLPMERTVDLALKEPFCLIGSDGGIEYSANANSHPRGAGCFSTAVRHALDIGMPLETILSKMTQGPRQLLRSILDNRGILAAGAMADLTVFDPAVINGTATVSNPNQFSKGMYLVVVNGRVAFAEGNLKEMNGVAIKY